MQSPTSQGRPYRSHLRPACHACRQRKSRCKIEGQSPSCLMCRVHGTECTFPTDSGQRGLRAYPAARNIRTTLTPLTPARTTTLAATGPTSTELPVHAGDSKISSSPAAVAIHHVSPADATPWTEPAVDGGGSCQPTPLSVDDAEEENPHIVGPANTRDSQVLADYLSSISSGTGGIRMIRPMPASRSKPVLFATVQKRPLGVDTGVSLLHQKLQTIEKLLEPYLEDLVDLYFSKENVCLPLLDAVSFRSQYGHAKDKISPALLACLYAHSMVYWHCSPRLRSQRPPDNRFVWNLANEVLYSELLLSPGISTVTAVLFNVGGRPTTSMVGNGVQLGAAVSLAHSLGLNRDPLPWDIPDAEKLLRMKIWWSLLIHDKWISLAYGTPSHIQMGQHDVPRPEARHFFRQGESETPEALEAASVFVALAGLTEVLDYYLQHLYQVSGIDGHSISGLEFRLNQWIEGLGADVRHIITRGTQLSLPGAANLRLLYLSVQLLLRRLKLEEDGEKEAIGQEAIANRYMQVRRTAEEIVLLVQELREEQLRDFWLPVAAFVFPTTTIFLLRCAFETEDSQAGLAQSSSLRLASDMITALRRHRETAGWELGDICLAQHAGIVERFMVPPHPDMSGLSLPAILPTDMSDMSFVDDLFPSLWDTLKGI